MDAPDSTCPYCGGRVVAGTAYVRGTFLGALLVGLSHQHLWFRAGKEKDVVVESGGERTAYRCEKCEAVTVFPARHQWKS